MKLDNAALMMQVAECECNARILAMLPKLIAVVNKMEIERFTRNGMPVPAYVQRSQGLTGISGTSRKYLHFGDYQVTAEIASDGVIEDIYGVYDPTGETPGLSSVAKWYLHTGIIHSRDFTPEQLQELYA